MSAYECLNLEVKDYIATVTLNRPPVNALSMGLYREIDEVFRELSDRISDVRVAILTGAGSTFCAGRDVKSADSEPQEKRQEIRRLAGESLYHCAVPVICAANGAALGAGFFLVTVCDIIIASEKAVFGLPEIDMGSCGGLTSKRRGLNEYQARKLYFTGERATAQQLCKMGMVDSVVAPNELMPAAMKLARNLASKSPLALRACKWSANETESIPDFEKAHRSIESRLSANLINTEDHKEAVRAFKEKRAPVFKGR